MKRNQDCEISTETAKLIAKDIMSKMGECMAKDSWYNSMIFDCEKCGIAKCQDNGICLMQCNAFFKEQSTMQWITIGKVLIIIIVVFILFYVPLSEFRSWKQRRDIRSMKNKNEESENNERQQHPTTDQNGDCEETRPVMESYSISSDSGTDLSRVDLRRPV